MTLFFIFASFLIAALVGTFIKHRGVIEWTSVCATVIALLASIHIGRQVSTMGTYTASSFFSVDSLTALVMLIVALVGFAASVYSVQYLREETVKKIIAFPRVREYFILLNLFLAAMFFALTANHPILTWIFIEATTLSTAFLISFYNKPSAMEAAWKYLILNSIGLLLAFFGTLLYLSSANVFGGNEQVSWHFLTTNAAWFDPLMIKIAFIFILIGYGTKVGFAPMHTWKPDAYSKAPAPLGALFSGALLPVALTVILKFKIITDIAVGESFSQNILIIFGVFSVAIAATIIMISKNYKRILAYSSIEHAGIIALGFGFGGIGIFAAMLHMIYHSLVKSALFFLSGNFMLTYGSSKIENVRGAMTTIPATAILFLVSFFAVSGAPPFGIFFTKITILAAGIFAHPVISIIALFFMTFLFIGFFKNITKMLFGEKMEHAKKGEANIWLVIPPFALLCVVLFLSFHLPVFMTTLLNNVAQNY